MKMNDYHTVRTRLIHRALPPGELPIELARVRQAAVTVLLRDHAGRAEVMIIKRADDPRDPWSGHLALPGGRADAVDANLVATAARETFEEVGISLTVTESFIGQLDTFAPTNPRLPLIEITPLIALAPPEISLQLSEEVAEAFWLPVSRMKEAGLSDVYHLQLGELTINRPAYPSPRGPIWGITERILTSFFELLD